MNIKLLPNITIIPVNNKTTNVNKSVRKKLKIQGKIINIKKINRNETGGYTITIISDSNDSNILQFVNAEVILSSIN